MESIELSHLWTAAAVVAGFQLAAFSWRLNRELNMEMLGYKTWLTVADILVVASFLLLVAGVFAAPVLSALPVDTAARLFGLAFVGFATSPMILAGHYNLYGPWRKRTPRPWVTSQEWVAIPVAAVFLVGYVIWWVIG